MLLCSVGSISRSAKALLGRAKAKVHWTLWHPSRALLDNKRTSECEVLFCYPRSASLFSKHNCFAARVRFLGELKLSSVVPVPRSTGPCATRLALFPSLTNRYSFPSLFHKPFPNDLSFPDIINIFYFIYHSSSSSFCTLLLYILEDIINANKHKISTCTNIIIPVAIEPISLW